MSKISFQPNAVGSGTFTIASPNSGTNRTLTLPDITGTMVSTDTSGNVGVSGTLTATGFQGPTGGLVSMQAFTSSGTWTKPAGVTKIKVYVTGGGGGGCSTNSDDLAAGGGAGRDQQLLKSLMYQVYQVYLLQWAQGKLPEVITEETVLFMVTPPLSALIVPLRQALMVEVSGLWVVMVVLLAEVILILMVVMGKAG